MCVLFLGAGIHSEPPDELRHIYPSKKKDFPLRGKELSEALADECIQRLDKERKPAPDDPSLTEERQLKRKIREKQCEKEHEYLMQRRGELQRTSWYYERLHRNRAALVEKITDGVETDKKPSALVRALAEIDFPVVITTNYDRLFETALRRFDKQPEIRIYNPNDGAAARDFRGNPDCRKPWLLKIHGCVSVPSSIVVTDEDYIRFVMRMGDHPDFGVVPQQIQVKLKNWVTLFVGYSLLDYNLRLLFRTLDRRTDPAELSSKFSVDPSPDLLIKATYRTLVSFIEQDSWIFVPDLYQRIFGRPMPA